MDRSIECSDGNSLVACVSGVADPNLMFSWKQEKYRGVIEIESCGSFVFSIKSFPKTFSPSFYESRTSVKVMVYCMVKLHGCPVPGALPNP